MPKSSLLNRRHFVATTMTAVAGAAAVGLNVGQAADPAARSGAAAPTKPAVAAAKTADKLPGELDVESLGNMLAAIGLEAERTETRYDFAFKSKHGDDWEMSVSTVLSTDNKTIWVMAWLDELPKNAADVPRTALLRLLSDNDKLGNGKFFAYVASNRRFVLQRVLQNENITSSRFRDVLVDLADSVASTYSHWSVAQWNSTGTESSTAQGAGTSVPAPSDPPSKAAATTGSSTSTKSGTSTSAGKTAASTSGSGTSTATQSKTAVPKTAVNTPATKSGTAVRK